MIILWTSLALPLLGALIVPGTLGRHIPNQEPTLFNGKIRKTTKLQRSQSGFPEAHPPSLNFRQVPSQSVSAPEFGSAILECEAGGNPPPTIHWLKDGRRVRPGATEDPANAAQEGRDEDETAVVEAPLGVSLTRSRLYLDCLVAGDESTYTCVAENPYLRIASDTKLNVIPPALLIGQEGDSGAAAAGELCLSKKSFGSPARIHMWTHSRLEVQGSDAQLFCRTSGVPRPSVLWLGPDERPITSGSKYQVLPNGDLLIRDLVWDDRGRYVCLAENERGSDKMTTYLYPAARERSTTDE